MKTMEEYIELAEASIHLSCDDRISFTAGKRAAERAQIYATLANAVATSQISHVTNISTVPERKHKPQFFESMNTVRTRWTEDEIAKAVLNATAAQQWYDDTPLGPMTAHNRLRSVIAATKP